MSRDPVTGLARRGTSNANQRGGSADRRRRKLYLLETYRANKDVHPVTGAAVPVGKGEPACRCYRCGALLVLRTMTVDRIKPAKLGGTYVRTNIRPCCSGCNSETGGALRGERAS